MSMLQYWLLTGFICGILFNARRIISEGKIKDDDDSWASYFGSFFIFSVAGFFPAIVIFGFIVAGIAELLGKISDGLSIGFILSIPVLIIFFTLFSTCTAKRVGAHCSDGTYSTATGSGACSFHGGVDSWDKEYWWDD